MVKKIIIRVVTLLLIFAAAVFTIGKLINRDTPDTTKEMSNATLPLVYMMEGDTQINALHGHKREMDVMALRDALTPIDSDRTVTIQIQPFEKKIEGIRFEILTSDGRTSLENTKVTKIREDENYVTATLQLQNKILIHTEYMMKIAVTAGNQEIYYYTRIIREDGLNARSYIDFVMGFYQNCLNGNDLNIEEFVEPEADADNSSFAHVDIHSSTSQMIWKGLSPQVYYKPIPNIRELNENTATIVMDYMISATDDESNVELYRVSEYYRMRYTEARILLLDFERTTSEIFRPEGPVLNEKGIVLGITDREVTSKTDSGGNFYAFVREGALWLYDVKENKLVQVFSFPQEKNSDARDTYSQNDIQIINIDEQGNMYFLVCGYMNRGIHEGESGVAVYSCNAAGSTVNECLFVDTKQAFSLLKQDTRALSYISEDRNVFYLLVNGEVYAIDMTTRQIENLVSDLMYDCYASSDSGGQFAWMNGKEPYNCTSITIMDLETRSTREITCGDGQRMKILGFIGEDFAYGLADTGDIDTDHEGNEIFPMNQVLIVNKSGETVKTYTPGDSYVSDAVIEGNLMKLSRIRRTGNGYEEAEEDQIVSSAAGEDITSGLTAVTTERKKEIHILKTGAAPNTSKPPQVIRCRQQIYEGSREIVLETKAQREDVYYVYAKGMLDGMYRSINQAVRRADEALGVVVDSRQQMVWERGNRQTKLDLDVETFPAVFLEYSLDADHIQEKMEQRVLDLTGCTLEQVLYFVSEGTPVLAKTPDGVVIIGGYDEYNTRLLKQGETELTYAGLQDSTAMFEEAGNVFITYFDPLTE